MCQNYPVYLSVLGTLQVVLVALVVSEVALAAESEAASEVESEAV